MKIKIPLAAALLMTAASAPAQLSGAGGAAASNPFAAASNLLPPGAAPAAADADAIFTCGSGSYPACTTAQLNRREVIRMNRTCPPPASRACVDYLMRSADTVTLQLLGNQANPATANEEFFKKCGTVPYRLCTSAEQKAQDEWKNGLTPGSAQGQVDEIAGMGNQMIGPAGPPPKPFEAKDFQAELAKARGNLEGDTVVDMGDSRFAYVNEKGDVQVCGSNRCDAPRPATAFPGIKDKIQAARSINSGAGTINADNPTGAAKATPGFPPTVDKLSTSSNDGASAMNNPARDLGAGIAADQDEMSAAGTGAPSAYAGSSGGGAAAKPPEVVKVDGAVAIAEGSKRGYTYIKMQEAARTSEGIIKGGAATFEKAAVPGRAEEPPVDEKYLGTIQAVPNQ